ncbi:MAG: fumarate hydratase [Alteromonas sp.]|nr:fumarate hydratase [Alteromonas sp.]MAY22059.1 fumarate hydratase [Flavobacteriaceae bacterium]|tara:strand:- start:831 stop:1520 length:690 start_codon:yes stop_codon:yes gene_type:complete
MKYIVISGDVISSTSLQSLHKEALETHLLNLLKDLKKEFQVFGRVIKGDYIECVVPQAKEGLRVALAIKSYVKSIPVEIEAYTKDKNRAKQFKVHGIRLAMGYGALERYQPEEGIIDGEAIYFSGREISSVSPTYNKERIVIKNTLFFASNNPDYNQRFLPLLSLLDVLLSKATARQCEVLYHKLLYREEEEISQLLGIGQSAVNQHSTSVGWNAIEEAVNYFNKVVAQ